MLKWFIMVLNMEICNWFVKLMDLWSCFFIFYFYCFFSLNFDFLFHYSLKRNNLGLDNEALADVFEKWNKVCFPQFFCFFKQIQSFLKMTQKNQGDLDSYLIEITRDILRHKHDDDNSKYTVDLVLDLAGQKGVSFWNFVNFNFLKKNIKKRYWQMDCYFSTWIRSTVDFD